MLKKIIAGILLTGLIGLLVAGAVNRTQAIAGQSGESHRQGRERNDTDQAAGPQGKGSAGQQGNQAQQNRQGRGGSSGSGEGTGQAIANDWLTLEGIVATVNSDALTVDLDNGGQLIVEGRAWSFAQQQGLSLHAGDQVRIAGFYEDGEFKVGQIENLTNPQTVFLRDETGRPLWAGRGRWGG